MTPTYVFAEIARPTKSSPGSIVEGWYVIDDGKVVMTERDGKPIVLGSAHVAQMLKPNDNPQLIAQRLLKQVRSRLRNDDNFFRRPLKLPDCRWVV
jgi:hypothetical protein